MVKIKRNLTDELNEFTRKLKQEEDDAVNYAFLNNADTNENPVVTVSAQLSKYIQQLKSKSLQHPRTVGRQLDHLSVVFANYAELKKEVFAFNNYILAHPVLSSKDKTEIDETNKIVARIAEKTTTLHHSLLTLPQKIATSLLSFAGAVTGFVAGAIAGACFGMIVGGAVSGMMSAFFGLDSQAVLATLMCGVISGATAGGVTNVRDGCKLAHQWAKYSLFAKPFNSLHTFEERTENYVRMKHGV